MKAAIPGFSDYQRIAMINALRKAFKDGKDAIEMVMMQILDPGASIWTDQSLLQPVKEDDRLLFEEPYELGEDSDMQDEQSFLAENTASSSHPNIELNMEVEQKLQELLVLNQLPQGLLPVERARHFLAIMNTDEERMQHLDMLQRWSTDPDLVELKNNPDIAQESDSSSSDEEMVFHGGKGFTGPGAYRLDENGNFIEKDPCDNISSTVGGKSKGKSSSRGGTGSGRGGFGNFQGLDEDNAVCGGAKGKK